MLKNYALTFLQLILTSYSEASKLTEKAATIANSAYKPNIVTSVVWWRSDPRFVTVFLKEFHGSTVITPINDGSHHRIREFNKALGYKQTVLFVTGVEEFEYFMILINQDLVNPIRLILVLTKPRTRKYLAVMTKTALRNDLADIVILSPGFGEEDIYVSTYFPYGNGVCGDFTPVELEPDTKNVFPNKFKNFHECPIKATLLNVPPYVNLEIENGTVRSVTGRDGSVLKFIIEILNSRLDIVSAEDHGGIGSYFNGTATGSFSDLVNQRADIIAPAAVINLKRYSVAQISHVYETADVSWHGPKRREIDNWLKVLLPFLTNITLYFILTSFIFIVIVMLFRRYKQDETVSSNSVFFQSFIILLGQFAKFETKSSLINSLFVVWIWFCMVMRIAYQGELVNGLQSKILEMPLGTLEEAINAVDGYGGTEVYREYYIGSQFTKNFKLLNLHDVEEYVKDISNGKRFLLVTDMSVVQQLAGIVQILDHPVTRAPACLFMRARWPAAKQVDELIYHAIETGFVAKIYQDQRHSWLKQIKQSEEDRHAEPMDLSILIGCFYGLGVLYLICFVIFIMEILYYKFVT